MNWYYDLGGQRQGPVPEAELDRLLASGTITTGTLVWCEGLADWQPLGTARPAGGAGAESVPEGWIRCTATGRFFPPSQIVWLDGKPYSAEAKPGLMQGVLQGGELPRGDEAERTGPAWEQRAQIGFFPAIWQTMKAVLLEPGRTFANMKRTGGLGTPLGYGVLLSTVGGLLSLLYEFAFQLDITRFLPPEFQQEPNPLLTTYRNYFLLGAALAMPLLMIVSAFISSGIWHLSLMICGGARRPFETTFRTHSYAMGSAALFAMLPVCGSWIGLIWALVCLCIGLTKTHEINTGRAVGAVLLPMGVCCVLYLLLIAAVIGLAVSARGIHH